ncbi:MAG: hypothetical protein L3K26_06410 [Candidatus Hydrogenedentes bacterium]|nr:hypothetical protein [Candidatus Hydrogenedentota bacterium]
MASKEKVDIKRSDQFQEVDEELSRAMAELDCTIDRVSAIFEGTADENGPAETLPVVQGPDSVEVESPDSVDAQAEAIAQTEKKGPEAEDDTVKASAE